MSSRGTSPGSSPWSQPGPASSCPSGTRSPRSSVRCPSPPRVATGCRVPGPGDSHLPWRLHFELGRIGGEQARLRILAEPELVQGLDGASQAEAVVLSEEVVPLRELAGARLV